MYSVICGCGNNPQKPSVQRALSRALGNLGVTGTLNYEALVEDFNRKLLTQLRSHSADAEYLETWVPEEDPVKSILNIVESAQAYGHDQVRLTVAKTTINSEQQQELLGLIAPLGRAKIVDEGESCELEVVLGCGRP